jgi:hypothetical protein
MTGDVMYRLQKIPVPAKSIFHMQMTERLGTDGLYWYCRFNGILEKMISAIRKMISAFMISMAFLRYFFTQVRLFVLIFKYNCFTYELQMPEVRLFILKIIFLTLNSTDTI